MKYSWIAVVVAGALTAGAAAQTGASGSATANTSVSAGQTGANAGANANAQVSGSSASAGANGQAQASHTGNRRHKEKDEGSSSGGSAANGLNDNAVSGALSSGTTLQAELTKPLDAKKAKAGDEFTAKATQDVKSNGQVVIRKGSKLIGHVTEAQARTKDNSESKLGLAFDKAVLKDGSEVTLNAVVQALAAAPSSPVSAPGDGIGAPSLPSAPAGGGGGGGMLGGVSGATHSTLGAAGNTLGSVGGSAAGAVNGTVNGAAGAATGGTLNGVSHGVVGLKGLDLSSAVASSSSAQASVISSSTQNVRLDSGTQMLLQVTGSAPR
jgi:hypothetical protein